MYQLRREDLTMKNKQGTNSRKPPLTGTQKKVRLVTLILLSPLIFFIIYSMIYVLVSDLWLWIAILGVIAFFTTWKR